MLRLSIVLGLFFAFNSFSFATISDRNPRAIFEYISNDEYDKIIELINSGIDVNITDPTFFNITPLMEISFKLERSNDNYLKIAKLLLEKGADPNQKSTSGANALFYAVLLHNNADLLNLFIQYGANLNDLFHDNKESILHVALENGRNGASKIFEVLANNRLNINSSDKNGLTPLMIAMEKTCVPQEGCGFKALEVQLLVDRGADLNVEDKYFSYTALKFGIDSSNEASVLSVSEIAEFEYLLEHGAKVDQEAINISSSPIMKKLLAKYL